MLKEFVSTYQVPILCAGASTAAVAAIRLATEVFVSNPGRLDGVGFVAHSGKLDYKEYHFHYAFFYAHVNRWFTPDGSWAG